MQVFDSLERTGTEYSVRVSFLELYNEELFDLLGSSDAQQAQQQSGAGQQKLAIRDNDQGVSVVQGADETMVKSAEEIFSVLDRGSARRSKAETLLNKQSSRSHSLFIITIWQKECTPEASTDRRLHHWRPCTCLYPPSAAASAAASVLPLLLLLSWLYLDGSGRRTLPGLEVLAP